MVGERVRLHRKAQRLSQEKLAELSDVHPTYISNIERGKVSASAYSFHRLAQALGIKLDDLLGFMAMGDNLDLENDLVEITGKIRQLDQAQRILYISAIKGMLPK